MTGRRRLASGRLHLASERLHLLSRRLRVVTRRLRLASGPIFSWKWPRFLPAGQAMRFAGLCWKRRVRASTRAHFFVKVATLLARRPKERTRRLRWKRRRRLSAN